MKEDIRFFSTICYLRCKGEWLMLYRNKKENDINEGKYVAPGGHFKMGESPEECIIREFEEETGVVLKKEQLQYRCYITFVLNEEDYEYMSVFTADIDEKPELHPQTVEGELHWIPEEKLFDLNLWEGDEIFLRKFLETDRFFTVYFGYRGDRLERFEVRDY